MPSSHHFYGTSASKRACWPLVNNLLSFLQSMSQIPLVQTSTSAALKLQFCLWKIEFAFFCLLGDRVNSPRANTWTQTKAAGLGFRKSIENRGEAFRPSSADFIRRIFRPFPDLLPSCPGSPAGRGVPAERAGPFWGSGHRPSRHPRMSRYFITVA